MNPLDRNKANVTAFYDLAFNQGRPREAIEKYTGATYIQHNPEVKDGKEGFIEYFEQLARDFPGKWVKFRRVLAEGDLVAVHCESEFPGFAQPHWAGMDIFRLDTDGRIVEHWDVLQAVPPEAAHGNGMF
jgi:predicted SnoaL-like aldol condensation-catalyzing enzyme